jgi:hypothetical protein
MVGASAAIFPQVAPGEAHAQDPSPAPVAKGSARPGQDVQAKPEPRRDPLETAEAGLRRARAAEKVAEAEKKAAEDFLARREAEVRPSELGLQCLEFLAERDLIAVDLTYKARARFKSRDTARSAAWAKLQARRIALDVARAAVREAEAVRDIAFADQWRSTDFGAKPARDQAEKDRDQAREALRARRGSLEAAKAEVRVAEAYHLIALTEQWSAADSDAEIDRAKAWLQLCEAGLALQVVLRDDAQAAADRATADLARAESEADRAKTEFDRVEREKGRICNFAIVIGAHFYLKESNAARDVSKVEVELARTRLDAAEEGLKTDERRVELAEQELASVIAKREATGEND